MATIVNTLEREISVSRKQNRFKNILFKSLLAGFAGYFLFLLTLYCTYSILYYLFNLNATAIASKDYLISLVGFAVLFVFYYKMLSGKTPH